MKKTILKITALVFAAAIICIALVSCGGKKSFVVGFDADFPPKEKKKLPGQLV